MNASTPYSTQILARGDAAAKRIGINRVAWLHLAAEKLLEDRRAADSTLTEDTKRSIDRHVPPGEKRPFPKKVHFTAWFDSGKQGKEWPGTFDIAFNKGFYWHAAKAVPDDAASR